MKIPRLFLYLILLTLTTGQHIQAAPKFPEFGYRVGTAKGADFYWTVEPWDGSDARFIKVRRTIDNQIAHHALRSSLLAQYRRVAMSTPTDVVAQFAWAYAAYRDYSKPDKGQDQLQILKGVREALEVPDSPHSYEYTRMHWFFAWWGLQRQSMGPGILEKCAVRLLKHSPDDWDLKYTMAYEYSSYKETNAKALLWAKGYAQKYPERPSCNFLLGQVYEARLGLWWGQKDGLIAQSYFQKYINSPLTTEAEKKNARAHIDTVNLMIATFRKSKRLKP